MANGQIHGLVARTLQCFLQDTYGAALWQKTAARAGLDPADFEAMLDYDADLVSQVLQAAELELGKPRDVMLEDIGTYLVTHPHNEGLRRLMRYGGEDFVDFLYSLEELPGRARLAVPDLDLPALELRDVTRLHFTLVCACRAPDSAGFSHVLAGLLRAMADDYGALALLDIRCAPDGSELIEISVVETAYAAGRRFDLGAHGAGWRR